MRFAVIAVYFSVLSSLSFAAEANFFHLFPRPLPIEEPRLDLPLPYEKGPYQVTSYTSGLSDRAYRSARIYYPRGLEGQTLAATTLSGGFTNSKEQMSWLGELLASHGIVTIIFTPTNRFTTRASVWEKGHKGAFLKLISESANPRSPLYDLVDAERIGMMGYSLGGAGSILAGDDMNYKVKAVISLCAYNPIVPRKDIPHLFITGTNDNVAPSTRILRTFNAMSSVSVKAYARFNALGHMDPLNYGSKHKEISKYAVSWFKAFVEGDLDYMNFLNGDESKKDKGNRLVFRSPSDYIFYDN